MTRQLARLEVGATWETVGRTRTPHPWDAVKHPTDHCVGCDGKCQWWCHYFHGGMAGAHDGSHGITCAVCFPPKPRAGK